ncbi:hypothetical protein Ancab_002606 [Ancistrocladus abbreviatus]
MWSKEVFGNLDSENEETTKITDTIDEKENEETTKLTDTIDEKVAAGRAIEEEIQVRRVPRHVAALGIVKKACGDSNQEESGFRRLMTAGMVSMVTVRIVG